MKLNKYVLFLTAQTLFSVAVANAQDISVIKESDVEYTKLNPARGDASPQAGTLWGDRAGKEATGFLFKPVDGFESPPHIHNVTYRGIVIRGQIHNDDPNAENMWMPSGSFWIQPKGESHITAAKGHDSLAYIEIDEGPYLVKPADQAFDSGERALNVDTSNIVWVNADNINWNDLPNTLTKESASAPLHTSVQQAFLWGNTEENGVLGSLLKLPKGFSGEIQSESLLRGVIINGDVDYQTEQATEKLTAGGFFSSDKQAVHKISCVVQEECTVYLRSQGLFNVISE